MTLTPRKIIVLILIGILFLLALALTDVQPAGATTTDACWSWRTTCTAYRTIFGVRVCYAWRLTCVGSSQD